MVNLIFGWLGGIILIADKFIWNYEGKEKYQKKNTKGFILFLKKFEKKKRKYI